MAKTPKKQKEIIAEITQQEAKAVKRKNLFNVPAEALDKSSSSGEFPLRTYEMFRNLFVGIN